MGFDFSALPGLNGEVNIRRLETKEFALLKRIYDQSQTYARDQANQKPPKTTRNIPPHENRPAKSISTFISALGEGIAKPHLYGVELVPPASVKGNPDTRTLSLLCEATEFPGTSIATASTRTYGPNLEMPYLRVNEPITMTFIMDARFHNKLFFDMWMNSIVDNGTVNTTGTNNVGFFEDYATNIGIYQLDAQEDRIYSYHIQNAYPKAVSPISLAYGSVNEYHKISVQFVYERAALYEIEYVPEPPYTSPKTQMNSVLRGESLVQELRTPSSGLSGFIAKGVQPSTNTIQEQINGSIRNDAGVIPGTTAVTRTTGILNVYNT